MDTLIREKLMEIEHMIVLPPQVNAVITDLEQAGLEAYFVGGAVGNYVCDCLQLLTIESSTFTPL